MAEVTILLPKFYFILQGALVTLQYSFISVLLGLCLGSLLAIFKISSFFTLRLLADIYTSIFRGTPLLVQLSIVYFALPALLHINLSVFSAGIIAFSLNSAAYVSEIIRAGINSVDVGQVEAAKCLGVSRFLTIKDIILPQALKSVLPALVNEWINLIKESAIISTIGAMDIMRRAQFVSAETYDYFGPMLAAAAIYYVLVMIVTICMKILEAKLK